MKYFISFLAGAAVGAAGVYLYFRNRIDTMVRETVTEEMERFFIRQEQMMSAPEVEEVKVADEEPKVSEIPDTTEKTSIVKMTEIIRTNYRSNDGIEEDDDKDEEYISDEEMTTLLETSRQRMSEMPHLINEDERTTCVGYDSEEYTWYPESDLVTDVYDNKVDDISEYFPNIDWRKELKDKSEIVIRVPNEATDYTIFNDSFDVKK